MHRTRNTIVEGSSLISTGLVTRGRLDLKQTPESMQGNTTQAYQGMRVSHGGRVIIS